MSTTTAPRVTVTKLERVANDDRPYWQARVHSNGEHVAVSNRYGSWQTADGAREVAPPVAAVLQAHLPRGERGRR